jgi:hypothetical protein
MTATSNESNIERIIGAVMLIVFSIAFATLVVGLILWSTVPASDLGMVWLSAGLLGLLLNPALRLAWTLATALRRRDWLLLLATLVVIAILGALTLREAATH